MNIQFKKIYPLLFITFSYLFSVSAPPFPFEVKQHDGSKISVRMYGHEFYNWLETEDGYVIEFVANETNQGLYYSLLNENGKFTASDILVTYPTPLDLDIPKHLRELNPEVRKSDLKKSNMHSGIHSSFERSSSWSQIKPLIFLADFSDIDHSYTADDFNQLLFSEDLSQNTDFPEGYEGHENYNISVRDYYEEISNATLDISGNMSSIINWHEVAHNHDYYTDGDQGFGNGPNGISHSAAALVVEIAVDIEDDIDFSQFDGNGDGAVDVIVLIIEGKGGSYSASNHFWPHMSVVPTLSNGLEDIDNTAQTNSEGILYMDGVAIQNYILIHEQYYWNHSGANSGDIHPIGTICHELGHILGLPDLYDTSENGASGIGAWGLMGSGNWQNQTSPAYMSAWSRIHLGFIDPILLENETDYDLTILPTELYADGVAFILPMDPNIPHEYILLENRQRLGSDMHLAETGMLVWHIDENITDMYPAMNNVNVNPEFYGVNLLQADGQEELYDDNNVADSGDPFPGSMDINAINDNTIPGLQLYNYDRNADGIVDMGGESRIEIHSIEESLNEINCIIDVPNTNGTIISYDEGNYGIWGYPDQAGLHWAGIRFNGVEGNILSGLQTVFESTNSPYYVDNYIIKIWEGWVGNKPENLIYMYNGLINWNSDENRNGGWAHLSLLSEEIPLQNGTDYYLEINFDDGKYTFDKALYSNSVSSGNSYYRSSEHGNCHILDDGDWNLRAIIGGCGTYQNKEVWPGNTDADSTVSETDIIPIGLYWGLSGCSRSGDAYKWENNSQPMGWENTCATHADANGDGIVDIADVLVVLVNWGKETADFSGDPYIIDQNCINVGDVTSYEDNFYQIYQSLDGNSENEILLRSYLNELFYFSDFPANYYLSSIFPNPFNSATKISFIIPESERVQISVFNTLGRRLKVLLDSEMDSGEHSIYWNPTNYASGIYIIHFQTNEFTMTQKVVLLK